VVDEYVTSAIATGQTGVVAVYGIPGRSCGSHSAGGYSEADYRTFIDEVVAGIGGRRVAVILEPDAVLQLDRCAEMEGDRRGLLKYGAAQLTAAGATVYIDAGSSNAGSPEEMAAKLHQVGIEDVRGFALNVSNFLPTADVRAYAEKLSTLLGGKSYVIDTSRNGNGGDGEWCNTPGRALGATPGMTTFGRQDANLWIKSVGASDGPCYGGPNAGTWWTQYAVDIARNSPGIPASSVSPTSMISTWNVGASGCTTITLPITGTVGATVDWGDGTKEKITSGLPSHTYAEPQGLEFITVDGKFTKWGGNGNWSSKCLLKVSKWGTTGTTSLDHGFAGTTNLTHISRIPATVTTLSNAFRGSTGFKESINWDMSRVTSMASMFAGSDYNRPIAHWNVSGVTSMAGMFADTTAFNSPLEGWDTSSVTDFSEMFRSSQSYNQPVSSWRTGAGTTFARMFENAAQFNQQLKTWDLGNATTVNAMFKGAPRFNQALSTWNVSKVTDFNHVFNQAVSFNQPLSSWDVSSGVKMAYMFRGASRYNQGMTGWSTSKVTDMSFMFFGASAFSKDLRSWNVANVGSRVSFAEGSALSKAQTPAFG
jgi:surface protein